MEAAARRLVVIAVDDYGLQDDKFTAGIGDQVATVTGWLAHPDLDEERRFDLRQADRLTSVTDLRAFLDGECLHETPWDESLVVYITGHGVAGRSQRHYLTFAASDLDRLLTTAFPTSEVIAAVLDSDAEHVLVLVDSCFSGVLKRELAALVEDLRTSRRRLSSLAVITSGDSTQKPRVGEFTRLLQSGLDLAKDESAGFTASHLSFEDWEKLLNTAADDNPGLLRALWVCPDSRRDKPSPCLPNPHYRPPEQLVAKARRSVALTAPLAEYWLSRASGRTSDSDPGWYFSGRATLMQSLTTFVTEGTGVIVVTGAAGSGKSALLARLVTLSDPLFMTESRFAHTAQHIPADLRPRPGAVDAAVLARGKSALDLTDDLLAAFDLTAAPEEPPLQVLLNHLTDLERASTPVTVVLDALDEAEQPLACLSDVVGPLAWLRHLDGSPAVRLVLGMRSSAIDDTNKLQDTAADQLLGALHTVLQPGIGHGEVPLTHLRTDGPETADDIAAYAQALLQDHPDSPYTAQDTLTAHTAQVIAEAVTPSFLDARLAAAQLRGAPVRQDVNDPQWRSRLQAGTTALLRDDLARVARDHHVAPALLLAVLRATAFAQGNGLPWAEVWPAVTAAVLTPDAPGQHDIAAAIRLVQHSRLIGYLTTGEEDGRAVYRPVHQRVAEVLLKQPHLLTLAAYEPDTGERERVHRDIATACANLARAAGQLAPHPYVRRHTVAHAQAGRALTDDVMPLPLAARESSGTLRARLGLPLPIDDPSRRVLTAVGLIEPYVDESTDYRSRVGSIYFRLAATAEPGPFPAPDDSQVASPLPLQPVRVPWQPHTNVVASPADHVHDMCALRTVDGRSLIAAGTRHGIGVWDSTTGQQLVHIPTSSVYCLAVARGSSGRPFLVAGTTQGAAVFDPLSGRRLASLHRTGAGRVHVLADGPSRWMIAVHIHREMVLWQPSEDLVHRVTWPDEVKPATRNLWVSDARGHRYRLCRTYRGNLALFDPLTQDTIMTGLANSSERTVAAATGPSGHDVLAIPRRREVQLVSPFDGEPLAPLPVETKRAVSLDDRKHKTMLGAVTDDSIAVWRLSEREPRRMGLYPAQPQTTLLRGVPGRGGRGWKLASAGHEGILLWDRTDSRQQRRSSQPSLVNAPGTPRLMSVVSGDAGNEFLAVATGHTVALIDPSTGETLAEYASRLPVRAVEAIPGPNEEAAVLVEHDKGIDLWNAARQHLEPVAGPLRRSLWSVVCLPDGDPTLVVGGGAGLSTMSLTNRTTRGDFAFPHRLDMSACVALPSPRDASAILWASKPGLLLWNLDSNQITPITSPVVAVPFRHTAVTLVPLTADHDLVAAATSRGITLWDTATWTPLRHIDTPLTTAMISLPYKNGSSVLVTANGTGVRLWDPRTGDLIHSLLTAAPVTNLARTSVDGQTLHLGGPAGLATLKWVPGAASP
ncbi:AAA family ATPase [Streptomyces sp. NPDC088337]|uniref:AAA family ATPase n=1 Tax=unclassified Streptomyces TaxID=2593676 RepID=UPI00381A9EB1